METIRRAINDGTITQSTAATVEHFKFKVTNRRPRKKKKKDTTPFFPALVAVCKKCGSPVVADRCTDQTCVYSDHSQSTELNAIYDSVNGTPLPDEEHPDYPRNDWQHEVANGDTKLGYAEWVAHKLEAAKV